MNLLKIPLSELTCSCPSCIKKLIKTLNNIENIKKAEMKKDLLVIQVTKINESDLKKIISQLMNNIAKNTNYCSLVN